MQKYGICIITTENFWEKIMSELNYVCGHIGILFYGSGKRKELNV